MSLRAEATPEAAKPSGSAPNDVGGGGTPHLTIAIFTAIALVAFVIVASLYSLEERRDLIDAAATRTQALARTLEQHASRTFDLADLLLSTAIGAPPGAPEGQEPEAAWARFQQWLPRAPQIVGAYLVDAKGRLAEARNSSPADADMSSRDFVRAHLEGASRDRLFVGRPIRLEKSGAWVIPASRGMRRADGKLQAILVALIERSHFTDFFDTLALGRDGEVGLYSAEGEPIVERPYANAESSAAAAPPLAGGHENATVEDETARDGQRRVATYRAVAGYPLWVRAALSRADALAPWRLDLWRYAGALLGIAIVLAAFDLILMRQLRQREQDRLALRAAMVQAETASRVKSEFLANISHELRTPLNAVIGFAEIIERRLAETAEGDPIVDYARHIRESGTHLLGLINDVLDLSKAEAGHMELDEAVVDVRTVIDQCLSVIAMLAKMGQVAVRVDATDPLPTLQADEAKLRQILINLLSNAIKFTPAGGTVTVRPTRNAEGGITIAVTDTGIGMSADEIPIALEPFGQIGSAMSRRHSGTGLGLPLTKRLVELHGGTLEVASAPGKGTTVAVNFPAERIVEAGIAAAPQG